MIRGRHRRLLGLLSYSVRPHICEIRSYTRFVVIQVPLSYSVRPHICKIRSYTRFVVLQVPFPHKSRSYTRSFLIRDPFSYKVRFHTRSALIQDPFSYTIRCHTRCVLIEGLLSCKVRRLSYKVYTQEKSAGSHTRSTLRKSPPALTQGLHSGKVRRLSYKVYTQEKSAGSHTRSTLRKSPPALTQVGTDRRCVLYHTKDRIRLRCSDKRRGQPFAVSIPNLINPINPVDISVHHPPSSPMPALHPKPLATSVSPSCPNRLITDHFSLWLRSSMYP